MLLFGFKAEDVASKGTPSFVLSTPQYPLFSQFYGVSSVLMAYEILTLKEFAEYLKLAEKTAYRLAAEGRLPGFKVGGSWRCLELSATANARYSSNTLSG